MARVQWALFLFFEGWNGDVGQKKVLLLQLLIWIMVITYLLAQCWRLMLRRMA